MQQELLVELITAVRAQTEAINRLVQHRQGESDIEENQEYMTVNQAAKALQRTPRTIRNWIAEGKLRAVKMARGLQQDQYYIHRASIDNLMRPGRRERRIMV